MDFEIRDVDPYKKPDEISLMNPYGDVPVLVDRELTLYESNIINEFIDERFPHPQLMPTDPSLRAKARLLLFNFEREIFSHVDKLENGKDEALYQTRLAMKEKLTQLTPIISKSKFMLGDEFSMIDAALAPLLWRLDHYQISLPDSAAPLMKYAERVFSRPAFSEGLTAHEKIMRR
jgi:RNA polymerase-associated protein